MSAETPPRLAAARDDQAGSCPAPTRSTLFWRTFLPWQMWRFVWINWKMLAIIRRSHRSRHS
jgi:hypothetical protein